MIAILKQSASDEAVGHIVSWIEKKGLKTDVSRGENETIIGLVGDTTKIDPFLLESMDVVERVQRVSEPFKRANRKFHPEDSVIDCGHGVKIGGDQFQVAILEGTVGSSVAADRLQGFTDAMAESPNSGKYNVICSQTGEYTRAKGMEVMESFLKSDGDKIDILFSCNGDMALGAIQAIEAAGLKPGEDIVIVSIDAAKGEFNAMIEGKMNCAVEHTPNFGETLMETAKKIVAGEEVPATIELEEGIFPADIAEQELPNRTY